MSGTGWERQTAPPKTSLAPVAGVPRPNGTVEKDCEDAAGIDGASNRTNSHALLVLVPSRTVPIVTTPHTYDHSSGRLAGCAVGFVSLYRRFTESCLVFLPHSREPITTVRPTETLTNQGYGI